MDREVVLVAVEPERVGSAVAVDIVIAVAIENHIVAVARVEILISRPADQDIAVLKDAMSL